MENVFICYDQKTLFTLDNIIHHELKHNFTRDDRINACEKEK